MVQAESYYEMELGPFLRKLREGLSLRDVYVATGISISYLSEVERGMREPGADATRRSLQRRRARPGQMRRPERRRSARSTNRRGSRGGPRLRVRHG